jgi:integrase
VVLGTVADLSAGDARRKARAILADVAVDGLPKPVVQTADPTFDDYAEHFWSDYARHWKPRTQTTNRRMIDHELKPVFGERTLAQIRKADVLRWRDDLSARPSMLNRALPVLSVMMRYAEQLGHRPRGSNPCRGTPRYRSTPKERFLSPAEYRRLGAVLASAEPDAPDAVAVIRLLLLTGARVSEILELQWDRVHPPRLTCQTARKRPSGGQGGT